MQFAEQGDGKGISGFGVFGRLNEAVRAGRSGYEVKERAVVWFDKIG